MAMDTARKTGGWLLSAVLLLGVLPHVAAGDAGEDLLDLYAETYRFRLGRPEVVRVTPDAAAVLFLRSGPRDPTRALFELDLASGRERTLATASDLLGGEAETLSAEEQARRERQRVSARGIASYELSPDGRSVLVPLSGRLFLVDRADGSVRELAGSPVPAIDARFSPDGSTVSCVRDGEIYLIGLADGVERPLTRGAGGGVTHGLAEFVAQEEMGRDHGYWWSPDSTRILYQRTDTSALERFHIADATHPDRPPDSWPYPRPGKPNAEVTLFIVPAAGGETTPVVWDRAEYEYLAAVRWEPDAPLTILVQNRRQTEERLLTVDPASGRTSTLLIESDASWLNLHDAMPFWLPGGDRFLWVSERDGAPRLELRARDGTRLRALDGGQSGFRRFEAYLERADAVVVRAGTDPTRASLHSLSLTGGARSKPLGDGDGVESVVSSGSRELIVYRSAGENRSERYRLAGAGGPLPLELRSAAELPPSMPRLEFVEVGDGPSFHAVLVRPRTYEAGQRYPVLLHVYGGPGSQMVQRDAGRYLLDQWFADHGYVVVSIDGRGTPGRGRDWERAIKGNLIERPLQDQVAALRALGARFPELDLERVGIWGWSFGGYFSAMAVLMRPDVFHVGAAGAPVVSWEGYDTHYTERYMDLPQLNPSGYRDADALTYAGGLRRPLMLVHGTADDNVYFVHSLKLADALLREGKPFEFLPLPGLTHMVSDRQVVRRMYHRMLALFDEHLARRDAGTE